MKQARIAIFEDIVPYAQVFESMLKHDGHDIVGLVHTMEGAKTFVDETPEDGLDVALVDGNLDERRVDQQDGAEICRLLRAKFHDLVIIGISATGKVEGAEPNLEKMDAFSEINDVIHRL